MPTFGYTGKTPTGESIHGELGAATPREAVKILRRRNLVVTRLYEHRVQGEIPTNRASWTIPLGGGVRAQDLVAVTHQWAALLKSGIPLLACLEMLSTHADGYHLRQALRAVHRDVANGSMLAEALGKHPRIFTRFFVSMVQAGEATGTLDGIFARLAVHLERSVALRGRVLSALAYPVVLLGVALAVLVFMLAWIVPLFSQMFEEFGESLPWLTQLVVASGTFLQGHAWSFCAVFLLTGLAVKFWSRLPGGRKVLDGALLDLPMVGNMVRKFVIVQFSRTLAMLIRSGVSILDGLLMAGKITGNVVVEQAVSRVEGKIREGKPLAQELAGCGIFPGMAVHMVAVGEATGSLDRMLEKIADLYEQEVDRAITTATALVEPMVILLIGLGIGLLVVAMYLPVFSLGTLVG